MKKWGGGGGESEKSCMVGLGYQINVIRNRERLHACSYILYWY